MGVNYTQSCIIGIELDYDQVKEVISPAKYEEQNRYNSRTGEVVRTESVLVKHEESVFKGFGVENECFYEFAEELAAKYELDAAVIYADYETRGYLGKRLGDSRDFGRIGFLDGNVSVTEIIKVRTEIAQKLDIKTEDVKIHFTSDVG